MVTDLSELTIALVSNLNSPARDIELSEAYQNLPRILSTLVMSSPSKPSTSADSDSMEDEMQTRRLRRRVIKEKDNFLHSCKRRVISKPKKKEFNNTTAFVHKLYTQKIGRGFRPTSLETIFEDPITVKDEVKLIGLKKLRRSLSCSDGLNITKATIKNRRLKIKKIFGRKPFHKKIALEELMNRLNPTLERPSLDASICKLDEATTSAGNKVDSSDENNSHLTVSVNVDCALEEL